MRSDAGIDYRADIDGLRGVAVLLVVGFHAFPAWVPGGFIGVDAFFVISGYLISSIIFRGLAAGTFTLADFYARRVRRIFPSLLVVLCACYAFGWIALLSDEFTSLSKHVVGGAGFVSNLVLLRESGYFDTSAHLKPLLHLWSLGIEEQFYLLWPLLLALAWRWKGPMLLLLAGLTLASFGINVWRLEGDPVGTFYLPWTRLWELLAGAMLAYLQFRAAPQAVEEPVADWRPHTLAFLGIAAIIAAAASLDRDSAFPGVLASLPVLGAVALISAGPGTWINRRILASPLLVWFGLVSFPLYLWHWPLLSFAHVVGSADPVWEVRLAAVVLAVVLSWVTYRWVELPLRFGKRKNLAAASLAIGMLAIGTVAFATYRAGGVPSRLPDHMRVVVTPAKRVCGAPYPAAAVCWGPNTTAKGIVMLIGDSHGVAFAPGLAHALTKVRPDVTLVSVNQAGCVPFAGVRAFDSLGEERECEPAFTNAYAFARDTPEVEAVVVVGRWASRVGRITGFGIEGKQELGTYRMEGVDNAPASNDEVFRMGMSKSLAMLPSEKMVVFMHQVPELGVDPGRWAPPPLRRSYGSESAPCEVPTREVLQRQKDYRSIAAAVLADYPAIVEFDPVSRLCDASRCSATEAGRLLYRDDDHLNSNGAILVASALLNQMPDSNSQATVSAAIP